LPRHVYFATLITLLIRRFSATDTLSIFTPPPAFCHITLDIAAALHYYALRFSLLRRRADAFMPDATLRMPGDALRSAPR